MTVVFSLTCIFQHISVSASDFVIIIIPTSYCNYYCCEVYFLKKKNEAAKYHCIVACQNNN
jgi:D-alanyl-lipoteichoic acid acyltransferase DltB (MBOAT superfamily)